MKTLMKDLNGQNPRIGRKSKIVATASVLVLCPATTRWLREPKMASRSALLKLARDGHLLVCHAEPGAYFKERADASSCTLLSLPIGNMTRDSCA